MTSKPFWTLCIFLELGSFMRMNFQNRKNLRRAKFGRRTVPAIVVLEI